MSRNVRFQGRRFEIRIPRSAFGKLEAFALGKTAVLRADAGILCHYLSGNEAGRFISFQAPRLPGISACPTLPSRMFRYLGKMVWPEGLIVYYPSPGHWESWQWLGAALILLLITGFTLSHLRKQPCLIFGWLWFLGTLVPVIGIAGNSYASLADRYMYIPSIGLFVAVVWALADMAIRWKLRPLISVVAWAVLLVFGVVSWVQIGYWRNSITLWTHCLAVNPVNDVAQFQFGWVLGRAGRFDEAMEHYREAVRINPNFQRANLNIGELLALKGGFPGVNQLHCQGDKNKSPLRQGS